MEGNNPIDQQTTEIERELRRNQLKIEDQEMTRRNLENLCEVWRTLNIPVKGTITPEVGLRKLVLEKFGEHLAKLSS